MTPFPETVSDPNIDDRPVPSIVFSYDLDTNIEANPIPSLLVLSAVIIILVKVRNFLCSCQRIPSLQLYHW